MSQSGPQPPQPPQHHTVTVLPLGVTLPLAPGQSLLEAALAAGLVLRSACRNGTCRECIARVVQGTVHHRIPWPGLSADEKAEGWVLPCVAVADSDVTLLQPKVDAR
jgi:ferredoxin